MCAASAMQRVSVMAREESERRAEAEPTTLDSERPDRELGVLRHFAATARDVLVVLDAFGTIEGVNAAAERLYGYRANDLRGRPAATLLTPPAAQMLHQTLRELADGAATTVDLTHVRVDGVLFSAPVSVFRSKTAAALTVFADATRSVPDPIVARGDRCVWQLRCAERIARTGSWHWQIEEDEVTWSDALRAIYGVSSDYQPSFAGYLAMVHPDDRELVATQISRARDERAPFEHDERVIRADGSVRVLHTFGTFVDEGDGHTALIGTCRDVTEERHREELLRRSDDLFRNVFDNAGSGIAVAESDGRIVVANPALASFLGATAADLSGSSVHDWIWPDDQREARDAHGRLLAGTSDVERLEVRARHVDGAPRWSDQTWSMQRARGGPLRLIIQARDASRHASREDELRRTRSELEDRVAARTRDLAAANEELESFTYAVSHDMRAPLRGIDGFSRALTEDCAHELGEQGLDYLRRISAAAQHMGHLIDDLLMLSRVTRTEMRRSPVDLSELARGLVEELRAADPLRNVDVSIAPDMRAVGDTMLLRVVLANLLSNAWKFTSRKPRARIEVGMTMTQTGPVFFVRDDGVGFDMSYVSKLFTPFRRLHRDDEFEGTGVGLATVRRIIRRHGGEVWAEGAVDQGATLRFTLGART